MENIQGVVEMERWQNVKVQSVQPAQWLLGNKSWEIKLDYIKDGEEGVDTSYPGGQEHYLQIMDQIDDNGHPFITFHFDTGVGEEKLETINVIGKRSNKYLSSREQDALGIKIDEEDQKRKQEIRDRRQMRSELMARMEKRKMKIKKEMLEKEAAERSIEERVEKQQKLFEQAGVQNFSEWWNKLGKYHFEARRLAKEVASLHNTPTKDKPLDTSIASEQCLSKSGQPSQDESMSESPSKKPGVLKRKRSISEKTESPPKKVRFVDSFLI